MINQLSNMNYDQNGREKDSNAAVLGLYEKSRPLLTKLGQCEIQAF